MTEQPKPLCTLEELIRNQDEYGIVFHRQLAPENSLFGANLSDANLRYADLRYADLRYADLSGAKGILSASEYLEENATFTPDGFLVGYKQKALHYASPNGWTFEPGEILSEVCNPCRVSDCASGVNFALTKNWSGFNPNLQIWEVHVKPQWLAGLVVPYHTDGKVRAEKVLLVQIVERD